MRRPWTPRVILAAAAGLCIALLAGCGGIPPEPFVVARAASAGPTQVPPVTAEAIRGPFQSFVAAHPGGVAVAWTPVGRPEQVQVLGSTTDIDAWSTIKAPISVAALKEASGPGEPGRTRTRIRAAIKESDNDAAAELFESLGDRAEAAAATEAVLRAAGDQRTRVTRNAEGEVRGFGRTAWRPEDAARLAATLPCSADAEFVYDAMGQVIPDHQWGLGSLEATSHFKGGWGQSDHGYLVRQLGVVDSRGGSIAVALMVQPKDGRHETGTATANALARWLVGRLGAGDVGTCPAQPSGAATGDQESVG